MFRKFLSGLVFGSGFAIAFVFIAYIGLQIIFPAVLNFTPGIICASFSLIVLAMFLLAPAITKFNGGFGVSVFGGSKAITEHSGECSLM